MEENSNPLKKYFRQPSIYVTLPSGANYAPEVLEPSKSGEIGVMPMTAKDEIRFKTPDALMNGEGVVQVIQSCVPQIKDAWNIKSYDLDTILIAIRIATYGETMDINFTVPGAKETVSHTAGWPQDRGEATDLPGHDRGQPEDLPGEQDVLGHTGLGVAAGGQAETFQ